MNLITTTTSQPVIPQIDHRRLSCPFTAALVNPTTPVSLVFPIPNPLAIYAPRLSVLLPITTSVGSSPSETGIPDTVIAGPPGKRVWLLIRYCERELAVIVLEPMLIGGGVSGRRDVDEPMTRAVWEEEVWRAMIVAPRVMLEPGARVWPDTIY